MDANREIILTCPQRPVSYSDTLTWQNSARSELLTSGGPGFLWLGCHSSVITFGRTSDHKNLLVSPQVLKVKGIEVHNIDRGGDVTWHGPGQLVGYPILDLQNYQKDLHWYLRSLEQVIVATLATWSLEAYALEGKTGVWVSQDGVDKKIASIGVHVSRWVTKHGFSFNVEPDLSSFDLINACGLNCQQTSLKKLLRENCPNFDQVRLKVIENFSRVFDTSLINQKQYA